VSPTVPSPVQKFQPPLSGLAAEKTIDQILDELNRIRAQKADLDRQEQELLKEARKKLDKLNDRANQMGVSPPPGLESGTSPLPFMPPTPLPGTLPPATSSSKSSKSSGSNRP
jgi:hypothetical protein